MLFGIAPELNGYTPERTRQLFERIEDELARAARRDRAWSPRSCRSSPATTGASSVTVEGFEAGPDTDTNASFNGVGPGLLQDAWGFR